MAGPSLIGLTGGIAAGKSEALRVLAELGAATLSTDDVVHGLLATDEEVAELLTERWGEEVAPAGSIDRARIASIVFDRPEELAWLETVLHPRVAVHLAEWHRSLGDDVSVAVVEVPLLFEGRMADVFDSTICIVAADNERERRATRRGTGELEGRSGRQLSQEQKAELATHVVANDGGIEEMRAELTALWPELEAVAG